MVNGFFDIEFHLDDLSRNGDPLVKLKSLIPWESFREPYVQCQYKWFQDSGYQKEVHLLRIDVSVPELLGSWQELSPVWFCLE